MPVSLRGLSWADPLCPPVWQGSVNGEQSGGGRAGAPDGGRWVNQRGEGAPCRGAGWGCAARQEHRGLFGAEGTVSVDRGKKTRVRPLATAHSKLCRCFEKTLLALARGREDATMLRGHGGGGEVGGSGSQGAVPLLRAQKRQALPSSRNRTSDLRMSTPAQSTVLRSTS